MGFVWYTIGLLDPGILLPPFSPEETDPGPISKRDRERYLTFESPHYDPVGVSPYFYKRLWAQLFEAIPLASLYS